MRVRETLGPKGRYINRAIVFESEGRTVKATFQVSRHEALVLLSGLREIASSVHGTPSRARALLHAVKATVSPWRAQCAPLRARGDAKSERSAAESET